MRSLIPCVAFLALSVCISGCRPLQGKIVNETNKGIIISVYDKNMRRIAYGDLPSRSSVAIQQNIEDISDIHYEKKGGRVCVLKNDEIKEEYVNGIWVIKLNECSN